MTPAATGPGAGKGRRTGPAFKFPSRLYVIVDPLGQRDRSHRALAAAALAAGAPLLQMRAKGLPTGRLVEVARELKALADRAGATFIVNDRADVARLVDAAGVHLGQEDLPPEAARRILGPHKVIGLSTHNVEQARAAAAQGIADYIGFGPMYATTSKENPDPVQSLEALQRVRREVSLPLVAIGGITAETMGEVLAAGADAVAMIGEIVRAPDVEARLLSLRRRLDENGD